MPTVNIHSTDSQRQTTHPEFILPPLAVLPQHEVGGLRHLMQINILASHLIDIVRPANGCVDKLPTPFFCCTPKGRLHEAADSPDNRRHVASEFRLAETWVGGVDDDGGVGEEGGERAGEENVED
jgi:hypothetical protein